MAKRSILRWIHIIFAIPVCGYIYSPFDAIPSFAWIVRLIFLPILVLTGLLLWKGHQLKRLVWKAQS